MPQLADRMSTLQPSAIIRMAQKAADLKASGQKIASLSIGVPGFTPPEYVYEAALKAVKADSGEYLPGRGSKGLLEAFIKTQAAKGFIYGMAEVCAQPGGKGALFNLLLALVNPGDRVLIPAPYWASYPEMAKLVGGVPVTPYAGPENNYKLTAEQLSAQLGDDVTVLIFNSPSNPTGMVYSRAELEGIAAVLRKHPDLWIISDDIYDHLIFSGEQRATHLLDVAPDLKDRLIIVQSISKTYGMPGWRVGLVAGPKPVVSALVDMASQSFTNLPAVPMAAAEAALNGPLDFLAPQLGRLQKHRDLTLAALKKLGLECPTPQGAFYVFPNIKNALGKTSAGGAVIKTDEDFCTALLAEQQVAAVPGGAFGDKHAIRLSYAGKEPDLLAGLEGLTKFVTSLK
ncbi:MAG TPA: pyridoxal phosphate-dependent aminotransferase [Alphaproteobacteria bacterium]|nr:pyridoxal phosphate-dependent aminotransferase [Alphaproteobacteria bacterium]